MNNKHGQSITVVSIDWPDRSNGSAIAIYSSLKFLGEIFDQVHFICLSQKPCPKDVTDEFRDVNFVYIDVIKRSPLFRFLKSMGSPWPGICQQFLNSDLIQKFDTTLRSILDDSHGRSLLFFEHLAPAVLLLKSRESRRFKKVFFRSHDVMYKAFQQVSESSSLIKQFAWQKEIKKIRELEDKIFKRVDFAWAITESNLLDYQKSHMDVQAVFPVWIECNEYTEDKIGFDSKNVVAHLGGSDLRKMDGLRRLIEETWPIVAEDVQQAKLILGGQKSELLDAPKRNIQGYGFIKDERTFLSKSRIFVNPQVSGSGIKIKSLVALAAGRILISTKNGVDGIGGQNGYHYYVEQHGSEFAQRIIYCLENMTEKEQLDYSRRARQFVLENFSQAAFRRNSAERLADEFLSE